MRKLLLLLAVIISNFSQAQPGTEAPWMLPPYLMVEDSEPTYQEIVNAGMLYWETHDKDTKGSGFKPFMRWVERSEAYVTADGTLQAVGEFETELSKKNLQGRNFITDTSNWGLQTSAMQTAVHGLLDRGV